MTHSRSVAATDSPDSPDSSARKASSGKAFADDLEDGLLASVVGLGDHVLLRLEVDVLEVLVEAHLDGGRRAGSLDRSLQLTG